MYRYKNAKFITSAAAKKGWIEDEMPEICFIGKSNVGKSTLLNALTNQKNLQKHHNNLVKLVCLIFLK